MGKKGAVKLWKGRDLRHLERDAVAADSQQPPPCGEEIMATSDGLRQP